MPCKTLVAVITADGPVYMTEQKIQRTDSTFPSLDLRNIGRVKICVHTRIWSSWSSVQQWRLFRSRGNQRPGQGLTRLVFPCCRLAAPAIRPSMGWREFKGRPGDCTNDADLIFSGYVRHRSICWIFLHSFATSAAFDVRRRSGLERGTTTTAAASIDTGLAPGWTGVDTYTS